MPDPSEGRDPTGGARNVEGGGRSTRGPNPDPGGDEQPGGLVPPYDDRTSGAGDGPASEERAASVNRQLSDTKSDNDGSTVSPAEEHAVSESEVTDEVPDSPKGVGKSTTRSGEDIADREGKEPGREDAGTQGKSGRPVGVSDERDSGSVDPQGSQGDAPNMPSGDQGG
jgi:hypothetical protein